MASITVRNLPDEVHKALRIRAASQGRSTEAEVREILAEAVTPKPKMRLGSTMASYSQADGLSEDEAGMLFQSRSNSPAKPMELE